MTHSAADVLPDRVRIALRELLEAEAEAARLRAEVGK